VEEPTRDRRRVGLLVAVAVIAVLLDLISKLIVVAHLTPGKSPRILGGLIYLSLGRNAGAAFGMATGLTIVFALVAVVVVVAIIRMARKLRSTPWAIALGLILGGATGNLIDRIFRAPGFLRGAVVDWISVFGPDGEHFPVFNLADSAITVGAIILVVTTLLGIGLDGRRVR
jgi:signal peptidase II